MGKGKCARNFGYLRGMRARPGIAKFGQRPREKALSIALVSSFLTGSGAIFYSISPPQSCAVALPFLALVTLTMTLNISPLLQNIMLSASYLRRLHQANLVASCWLEVGGSSRVPHPSCKRCHLGCGQLRKVR